MFYDGFSKTCNKFGVSPTKVLIALDISKSGLTRWKNGGSPTNETKKKIADYFDISVDELETGEIKTAPAEARANDEMNEMLEEIRRRPELKTLFSLSSKATTDDVNTTIKIIKALRGGQSDE